LETGNIINKKKLVIIHGFGATGLTFYKMLKPLSEHYHTFCPDLLGFGLSSRPNIKLTTYENIINFFVDSLEEWRKANNLEEFHLVGHSLGGYLASKYALKYPKYVSKLSLMSPVGVTDPNNNPVINNMELWRKVLTRASSPFWNLKLSYHKFFLISGMLGYIAVKRVVKIKYPLLDKQENDDLGHYFAKVMYLPENMENCVYYIFKPPVPSAIYPIEKELLKSHYKINFYFGEKDWMDREGCMNLCKLDSERFKMHIIKNSGHNMKLENPNEISNYLINKH
jgi:abhydrolase domain-containing protein 5